MLKLKGETMEVSDMVEKGAAVFADAEEAAFKIKREFRGLRKLFEAARDAGVIGSLQCQELASECDALATEFDANLWALHRKLTLIAQEKGVDLPAPRSGGDR